MTAANWEGEKFSEMYMMDDVELVQDWQSDLGDWKC